MSEASNKPRETRRLERGHDFYPSPRVLDALPALYDSEEVELSEKVLHLHYFSADSDWWVAELDRDEWLAFGYACLHGDADNAEWGYMSLPELEALYVRGGMKSEPEPDRSWLLLPQIIVERDLWWKPRTVSEAKLPGRAAM